jgi:hypothetical protein
MRRLKVKNLRNVLLFLLVCLLYAPVASAQSGAVVIKGQDLFSWSDYNGDGLMAVQSSDSEFFCNEDGDLIFYDWMDVFRPDGSIKYQDRGHFFTRVFLTTPEAFWADACASWNNSDLMVAEGISHQTYNDNDANADHPNRRDVWGYTVAGGLNDLLGLCEGGMVELNTVRRWMLKKDLSNCPPDCIDKAVIKGPRLNCPN